MASTVERLRELLKAEPGWTRADGAHVKGDYRIRPDRSTQSGRDSKAGTPSRWHLDYQGKRIDSHPTLGRAKEAADSHAEWVKRQPVEKAERTQADWNEIGRRNYEALRSGAGGPAKPQWRTRPILKEEDARDLDHAAAAHALRSGSAEEGERLAYEQYQRGHRLDSAAHHYHAAAKAQAGGNRELAQRHLLRYAQAARELGMDPLGKPGPEVGQRIRQLAQKKRAGYRSHPADVLKTEEPPRPPPEPHRDRVGPEPKKCQSCGKPTLATLYAVYDPEGKPKHYCRRCRASYARAAD